ncbi:lipase family protein [Psychromonas arctica]|uniref:lipase family protein n=1 Tax=Psychromonas arctica TaxID=168275 RepID=UPI000406861E|nr:Mbeg1-like protein [Psychromonas arctica]
MNRTIVILIMLMSAGCTTSNFRKIDHTYESKDHPEHQLRKHTDLQYLSCNYRYFDWMSDYQLEGAKDYYVFSLMASNVYRDSSSPYYAIPSWELESRYESDSGLVIDVYNFNSGEKYSVVYKGTDFSEGNDWATNFALVEPNQYSEAFEHLSKFVKENTNKEIYVTGHSLGGGIALNMAQRIEGVEAVVFNSSPRAFFNVDENVKNKKIHLFETGEILGPLNRTWLWLRTDNLQRYKYNYLDFLWWTFSPVKEHGMYLFSRGLLLTAIQAGSDSALVAFKNNIGRNKAEDIEWYVCESLYNKAN